jgi:hypothetical protein
MHNTPSTFTSFVHRAARNLTPFDLICPSYFGDSDGNRRGGYAKNLLISTYMIIHCHCSSLFITGVAEVRLPPSLSNDEIGLAS